MIRACIVMVAGCGMSAIAPRARCRGTRVEITAPSAADRAAGNIAVLHGSFAGDGMGREAEWTCMVSGGTERSIHGVVSVELRAHPTELQRITIGGEPTLIHIPPHGELAIASHPCANWELAARWLDDGSMHDAAVASPRDASCPDGYIDGGEIHEALDSHCAAHTGERAFVRCVRAAELALATDAPHALHFVDGQDLRPADRAAGGRRGSIDDDDTLRPGTPLAIALYGGFCPSWQTLDTGSEHVRIAPGIGERWSLAVDPEGRLRGVVRP